MNLRPSGYEPDELPGCSTPRHGVWAPALGAGPGLSGSGQACGWMVDVVVSECAFVLGLAGLAATDSPGP